MNGYKEMYYMLFNKITDVINDLQSVQAETEEAFLSQEPEQKVLHVLSEDKKPN